jgi:hypothetical protein
VQIKEIASLQVKIKIGENKRWGWSEIFGVYFGRGRNFGAVPRHGETKFKGQLKLPRDAIRVHRRELPLEACRWQLIRDACCRSAG